MVDTPQSVKTHRILVVDDDRISRELISLLLVSEGHRVTKAGSGKEALDSLEWSASAERPTAILVDLNMPGISGNALAEKMRSITGGDVLILAMSASKSPSTESFDGFLMKPLDVDLLAKMLAGGGYERIVQGDVPESEDCAALDEAIFAKLQGMMPGASVMEIFDACNVDVCHKIPAMTDLLRAGEMARLREAAHSIKGACSMIGAARLSQIAEKLETDSYNSDKGYELLKELSLARDELQRILLERKVGRLW